MVSNELRQFSNIWLTVGRFSLSDIIHETARSGNQRTRIS